MPTRLNYDLQALHDLRSAIKNGKTLSGHLTISAESKDQKKISIVTNAAGNGLFRWSERAGCYKMLAGTYDFSIRSWSDETARKNLRADWEAAHEDK